MSIIDGDGPLREEEGKMAFDAVDVLGVIRRLTQEYNGADNKRFF